MTGKTWIALLMLAVSCGGQSETAACNGDIPGEDAGDCAANERCIWNDDRGPLCLNCDEHPEQCARSSVPPEENE
jgi:hypothetical protein